MKRFTFLRIVDVQTGSINTIYKKWRTFLLIFSSYFKFKLIMQVMLNIGNISLSFLMLSFWIHNVMSCEFQTIDVLNLSILTIKMWSIVNSYIYFSSLFDNLVLRVIFAIIAICMALSKTKVFYWWVFFNDISLNLS